MPTALAKGVIIAASVLVAASIAAYESPQVREWFEKSSQKVAMAFRSLGEDIDRRRQRNDPSMQEDADERAEERRRKARQEILERSKILQDKRERAGKPSNTSRTPSFDSLVDNDGRLRDNNDNPWAASSGIDRGAAGLKSRNEHSHTPEDVDAPILLRQLDSRPPVSAIDPWESQYEQEMRNAWNIEIPPATNTQSHASESLIDLTPTTEDFPDPDYSVPDISNSEYFPATDRQPLSPISHSANHTAQHSLAGSTYLVGHSDAEMTDDDMSGLGDGIRTPASIWTEVDSSVSGDDHH